LSGSAERSLADFITQAPDFLMRRLDPINSGMTSLPFIRIESTVSTLHRMNTKTAHQCQCRMDLPVLDFTAASLVRQCFCSLTIVHAADIKSSCLLPPGCRHPDLSGKKLVIGWIGLIGLIGWIGWISWIG